MSSRLRVGNLGTAIDLSQFKTMFGEFGTVVDAQIMESPFSGKSRGFGFIEMKTEAEAAECLSKMNGKEYEGLKLVVTDAPAAEKPRRKRKA